MLGWFSPPPRPRRRDCGPPAETGTRFCRRNHKPTLTMGGAVSSVGRRRQALDRQGCAPVVCGDFGNVHFSAPPGAALQGEVVNWLQAEGLVLGRNCHPREQRLRGCFSPAAEQDQQTRGDSPAKGLREKGVVGSCPGKVRRLSL